MEHSLKQRLIGATVLVSLAVIFIPMLIGEDPERRQEIQLEIPKPPTQNQSKILPLPEKPVEELVKIDVQKPETSPAMPPPPVEQPTPKAEPKIAGWVVQVGSFSSRDNADNFSKALKTSGFKSFVKSADASGKTTYKVLVGPVSSREQAEQLSAKLKDKPEISSTWITQDP